MSAYQVNPETIESFIYFFKKESLSGSINFTSHGLDALKKNKEIKLWCRFGRLDDTPGERFDKDMHKLASACAKLNADAVNYRYPHEEKCEPIPVNLNFWQINKKADTAVQAYKNMQNWLYQCSEGPLMHSPLYKDMVRVKNALACYIVEKSNEYNKASWGK